ncbi:monooxygenase, putative [Talaromyces marneffei ATCC 18224]|uniref:Monooxygenase, putative n=1 Tax=Talaromyces marneffei (strain ATCC 18224 / CBS 334.59 / QM 7333) TaxID=441960 RepID=B6QCE1_TALMQ|nr:monooxygenase, putative [Talaromyces marneffei ATCC 18224]
MLELLGISYVLWEARSGIDEADGAGVGLMPNGLRILDQLGLFEDVHKHDSPHHSWEYRDADGWYHLSNTHSYESFENRVADPAVPFRLGYELTFIERRELLEILYQSIKDKSRITFSKKVSDVLTSDTSATIIATDGSQVQCGFVAGADGVRSVVRGAIARETINYQIPPEYLDSNYACVYGVSYALPEIAPGRAITIYRKDISILVFSGCKGKLVWFLFINLKCSIPLKQGKRYSTQDLEAFYEQIADVVVTTDVKFADIYNNRKAAVMTVLEEGITDVWYAGRLFLLGDAAHKMLPHNAMGASQAMESAACFVNQLMKLQNNTGSGQDSEPGISLADVQLCLETYAQKRKIRTKPVLNGANMACRCLLKKGPISKAHLSNLVDTTNEDFIGPKLLDFSLAEKLDNWPWDNDRVNYYTRQAYTLNQGMSVASL